MDIVNQTVYLTLASAVFWWVVMTIVMAWLNTGYDNNPHWHRLPYITINIIVFGTILTISTLHLTITWPLLWVLYLLHSMVVKRNSFPHMPVYPISLTAVSTMVWWVGYLLYRLKGGGSGL